MSVAAGALFLCDCGAEVMYVRPCQDEDALTPMCACGAVMYPAPADEEEPALTR
jgi:hypothetical protein